jgi:hypothetical protein
MTRKSLHERRNPERSLSSCFALSTFVKSESGTDSSCAFCCTNKTKTKTK